MRRLLSIVLALGLVLSFSLVTVAPALALEPEVWVDDDFTPSTPGWNVTCFATIQAGINNVELDGTVHVAAGDYKENITLDTNGVDLLGAGAGVTTIDADGSGWGVNAGSIDSTTTIDGFTITGGNTNYGGGILANSASPVVSNCVFTGNHADNRGGGMHNQNSSSPLVVNCVFTNNDATYGGGISCRSLSSPTIINCFIIGNTATEGGGIYSSDTPSPTITNCTIVGNTATNGGGIYVDGSINVPTITNSIIASNMATTAGGGIYCATPPFTIDYNDVFLNIAPVDADYSGCSAGTNSITENPVFVNAGIGDYHIQPTSNCIDLGDNLAPSLPTTDFDGEPRIFDGDDDGTATVDMGADEYYVPPPPGGTVGGEVYPIDKTSLLLPWLGLGAILVLAAGITLALRRRPSR
jgi:predicted outer membrane repeat protein